MQKGLKLHLNIKNKLGKSCIMWTTSFSYGCILIDYCNVYIIKIDTFTCYLWINTQLKCQWSVYLWGA